MKIGRVPRLGIEQPSERKPQTGAIAQGEGGAQRVFQALDERRIDAAGRLQIRETRQRFEALRFDGENACIQGTGLGAFAQVFTEIGEIEERGRIPGIERQGLLKFRGGRDVIAHKVAENDAAIEMHLFRLRYAGGERPLIGTQCLLEAISLALKHRKVVPGVGELGPASEYCAIRRHRLRDLVLALQLRRVAHRFGNFAHRLPRPRNS